MKHIKFFILTITCLFIKNNILAQQEPIITEKNTVCEIANYDMSNYYTTKSIITTLSESDTLFTTGTYEANKTYRWESSNIKLASLSDSYERINLYLDETFETETDYDLCYVLISTDKGSNWDTLSVRSGRNTGRTAIINLTKYTNNKVKIAFELISDDSYNFSGWTIYAAEIRHDILSSYSSENDLSTATINTDTLSGEFNTIDDTEFINNKIQLTCTIEKNGTGYQELDEYNFTIIETIDSIWTVDITYTEGQTYKDYRNIYNDPSNFKVIAPTDSSTRYAEFVFIMDNSGSMSDEQAAVKENVCNFIDSLKESNITARVGFCRFGQSSNSGQPNAEYADSGSSNLWWAEGTDYDLEDFKSDWASRNVTSGAYEPSYDAIIYCDSVYSINTAGYTRIFILITDEAMTNNNAKYSTITDPDIVIEALNQANTTLFALSIDTTVFRNDYETIATATGGKFYDITSDFSDILTDISSEISGRYQIIYSPTRLVFDGMQRDVQINAYETGSTDTLKLTGKNYTPGTAPRVVRTEETISRLHSTTTWEANVAAEISVYVFDYEEPRPQDADGYVKLYYRLLSDSTETYTEITMTATSVSATGDTVIWTATIPEESVLTPGIEYFIEAFDGKNISPSPIYPAQNRWTFAVLPNEAPIIIDNTNYGEEQYIDSLTYSGYAVGDTILFDVNITDITDWLDSVYISIQEPNSLQFARYAMATSDSTNYTYTLILSSGTTKVYIAATDNHGVTSSLGDEAQPISLTAYAAQCTDWEKLKLSSRTTTPYMEFLGEALTTEDTIYVCTNDSYLGDIILNKLTVNSYGYLPTSLTVYCDDVYTTEKDGYLPGDEIIFKIYQHSSGKTYKAYISSDEQSPLYFTDGLTIQIDTIAVFGQIISFDYSNKQEWWSTYVDAENYNLDDMLNDYSSYIEKVEDGDNNEWIPGNSSNALTTYEPGLGYQMTLNNKAQTVDMTFLGMQRTPEDEQVTIQTHDINGEEGTLVGIPYKTTQSVDNLLYDSNIDGITKKTDDKELTYYPNDPEWSLWEDDYYVYPGRAYKLIPTIDDYTYTFPPETSINTSSVALKTTSTEDSVTVTGASIPYTIASYNVAVCYHDSTIELDSYEFHKCFIDHLQNAVIPDSTYAHFAHMSISGQYRYSFLINNDSWLFEVKPHDIIRVYSASDSTVIGIGAVYNSLCIEVRCDAYFMEAGDSTFYTFSYYEDPYKEYPITVLKWSDHSTFKAKQYYLGTNSKGLIASCACYNKDLTVVSDWDCLDDSTAEQLLADQATDDEVIIDTDTDEIIDDTETDEIIDEIIADAETDEIVTDIAVTTSNCLRIHPNPVRDIAYLTICSDTIGNVRIMLYAMGGTKLIDKSVAVEQGEQIVPLNTPFPDGAYIVRVIFVDGTKETKQITIKK